MYRYNLLRKNQGFLLIGTYFVIFVLIVLAAVFFSQAVNEHSFTRKALAGLEAKYNAESGIDFVLTEIKYNTGFHTHVAELQGSNYVLVKNAAATPPEDPPSVMFSQVAHIDNDGNYAALNGDFVIKAYNDPTLSSDEIIVLSQGRHAEAERLFVAKYVPSSLYRFFIFTPDDYYFGSKTYDAGGGGIHANGKFIFSGRANIDNVSEMSTASRIEYYVEGYVPPGCAEGDCSPGGGGTTWDEVYWAWRSPWYNPYNTTDPELKYLNNPDGRNTGNKSGLLMEDPPGSGTYVSWNGDPARLKDPTLPVNYPIYANYTTINNVPIPNWLPNQTWQWNKYWHTVGGDYTYPKDYKSVDYLNTDQQRTSWDNFLIQNPSLQGKLMDFRTGGFNIEPLAINEGSYKQSAQDGGIYIEYLEGQEKPNVYYSGGDEPLPWTENQIKMNSKVIFEIKSFVDVNTTETKTIISFDIAALMQASNDINGGLSENIIYSNYPLFLSNAKSIFGDGLTTVCEKDVYFHGEYNIAMPIMASAAFWEQYPWEEYPEYWHWTVPSAAIAAKDIYTLSQFFNFPQTLPATFHNPNYPYVPDYVYGVSNWYWEHQAEMANIVPTELPELPGYHSFNYNVALVGYRAYQPKVLERWRHYSTTGDLYHPPGTNGVWQSAYRIINGAFIRLKDTDFPVLPGEEFDETVPRWCDDGFPTGYCRNAAYKGWPGDMGSITPTTDVYNYNQDFILNVPPGGLVGFSATVFLEIPNSEENWNYHYQAISVPQT